MLFYLLIYLSIYLSSDATDLDVPEHLRVLFLTTVEEAHLYSTLASDFAQLLIQHPDTFAISATDIGLCDLLGA